MVGESLIRAHTGDSVAAGYSRMVCYLPGARVQGISEQLHDLLKGEGEQLGALVHVGTNDIDRKRDEALQNECRDLRKRLKSTTSRAVTLDYIQCHMLVRVGTGR